MSDYTYISDFGSKDGKNTGDPDKVIKGADFETEFTEIQTAVNSKADTTSPTFTGTTTLATANITTLQISSTAVTSTAAELNILDGVTSTAAELNILDGVTASTAELNTLDGVTASTAELNILDGVTSNATELNLLDGKTAIAEYATGTFTPIVQAGGLTATVGSSAGRYIVVGDLVTVFIRFTNINTTSFGSGAQVIVKNLPFTSRDDSASDFYAAGSMYVSSINNPSSTDSGGWIPVVRDNKSEIYFYAAVNGNSQPEYLVFGDLGDDVADMHITLTYEK